MLRKYKNSNGNVEYNYNGRILDLPLQSIELKHVLRELEYRKEQNKEYTFGDYFNISPLASFFFSLFLIIFYLLYFAYCFDLFVPNLIQDLKNFGFEGTVAFFDFINYFIIFFLVTLIFFILNDYNKNKKKHEKTRLHNEKILPYFKTKIKEVEYIEEYKLDNNVLLDDCPKFQYSNIDKNVLIICLGIGHAIIVSFYFFYFLLLFDNIKLMEGEGTFDTIHYMDNSYTIFYKEYGQMKKMTFPKYIDVNIKINKDETEKKYSYYWLDFKSSVLNPKNKKNQPHVDIYINKDDYIKGSLLNK